jgi:hypothetical protein
MQNETLPFRPLRPATLIYNPAAQEAGSIGCFATTDGLDAWIVSCHHVLIGGEAAVAQAVFQPTDADGAAPVADTGAARTAPDLDVAAVRVGPGVGVLNAIAGLGAVGAEPAEAAPGMRVVKVGATTGLTEGEISDVEDDRLRIVPPPGFPRGYQLSAPGDSGALWLEAGTLKPVGLHYQGSAGGNIVAYARPLADVLAKLGLKLR